MSSDAILRSLELAIADAGPAADIMTTFATLTVEYPLPPEPTRPAGRQFLTENRDLEYLGDYTLTADGRLVEHLVRFDDVPGTDETTPVPVGDRPIPYSGTLSFYTSEDDVWWTYEATFVEGRCTAIRCLEGGKA